jgi:hypothetical protein
MKRSRSASSSSVSSYATADNGHKSWALPRRRPLTLARGVSPPPVRRDAPKQIAQQPTSPRAKRGKGHNAEPSTADVEAGLQDVDDHVAFFSAKLASFTNPDIKQSPIISHRDWLSLYHRNCTPEGHHFVVHQHDHPVAGTHYDLRLQINATSSISFAVMYGLPGDPNSKRLNRNATETRVHCLWNHLIETASPQTGTMLIWDTGDYEILEKHTSQSQDPQTDSDSDETAATKSSPQLSEPEKLASAFSQRKIRLRLHGTRLPPGYTIYLRLTKDNDRSTQPKAPAFKRRRTACGRPPPPPRRRSTTSSSSSSSSNPPSRRSSRPQSSSSAASIATKSSTHRDLQRTITSLKRLASPPSREGHQSQTSSIPRIQTSEDNGDDIDPYTPGDETAAATASDNQDEAIRQANAYPGATNSVNSIHQRKWYLSLDRALCGFMPVPTPIHVQQHHAKTYWVPRGNVVADPATRHAVASSTGGLGKLGPGFAKFHVLGRDVERSVVTGRLAADILRDEGVEGYVPRGLWRAVVE